MFLLRAALILSLAEAAPNLAPADAPPRGESYALLVGVQKYSEAKELRPLPYSERDVTELARLLRDSGYKADNVVLMTQTAANDDPRYTPMKKRILKELRLLLADRTPKTTRCCWRSPAMASTSATTRTATSARPTPSCGIRTRCCRWPTSTPSWRSAGRG